MIKIPSILFLIIQLVLFTSPLIAQLSADNKALESKIDSYLSNGVTNGFSGSILVAKEGKIILHKGYGMANKENNVPYQETTVSTIGSVTKQFTATAIMKLVEFNKLKVTDTLNKFFKELPDDKKNITIHQLLTHSAGLIDVIGGGDFDDIPMNHFFITLFATELLHKPGSRYSYSNAGYSILARIIEIASNQDYESFLNEHLFIPAGMKQTGYFLPKWDKNTIATGYAKNVVNMGTMISRFKKMEKVTWTLKGNGGIHSTVGDMYKWYKALKTNKVLSKALFEKLTTPYALMRVTHTHHYGYGWAIYNSDRNTKIISHNGGNAIFFHDFLWIPEEDVVIILFTNASSKETEVAWPIEKMLFNNAHQAKPIKKNLFYLVFDFIKNNDLKQSNKLISIIKDEYHSSIKNSNDLAYRLLSMEDTREWALKIFKLNTMFFPEDGNIQDSLAEGYLMNGKKEQAIKSYKKALELAPKNNCEWCKNTVIALDKLSKNK